MLQNLECSKQIIKIGEEMGNFLKLWNIWTDLFSHAVRLSPCFKEKCKFLKFLKNRSVFYVKSKDRK